ncbi:MAG: hypothetical protein WCO65_03230 [bacterium]
MVLKNYIECIRNSIGTRMFRSYYVDETDVLKNGDLSCAFYVSSILLLFGLIDRAHFTVKGTIFAMEQAGWYKIQQPEIGCVILWESVVEESDHLHIGFYAEEGQAISNRSSLGAIGEHALHYSGLDKGTEKKAKVLAFYWHKYLI